MRQAVQKKALFAIHKGGCSEGAPPLYIQGRPFRGSPSSLYKDGRSRVEICDQKSGYQRRDPSLLVERPRADPIDDHAVLAYHEEEEEAVALRLSHLIQEPQWPEDPVICSVSNCMLTRLWASGVRLRGTISKNLGSWLSGRLVSTEAACDSNEPAGPLEPGAWSLDV
jgi:hypothetical protein